MTLSSSPYRPPMPSSAGRSLPPPPGQPDPHNFNIPRDVHAAERRRTQRFMDDDWGSDGPKFAIVRQSLTAANERVSEFLPLCGLKRGYGCESGKLSNDFNLRWRIISPPQRSTSSGTSHSTKAASTKPTNRPSSLFLRFSTTTSVGFTANLLVRDTEKNDYEPTAVLDYKSARRYRTAFWMTD